MAIIEKNTESSFGGICLGVLEVVPSTSGSINFPEIVENTLNAPITFLGDGFEDLHCVNESVVFRESSNEVEGATLYSSEIVAIVAKDSAERVHNLEKLARKQWIVKFKDQNGNVKLMGRHLMGAAMRFSRDNKNAITQRNEITIEFILTSREPVPVYPY